MNRCPQSYVDIKRVKMLLVLLSLLSLTSLHPSHGVSVSVSVEEVLTHQKHSLDLSAKVTASTQPRLFSPQTYIQTFFGALGSGISSLIGLEGGAEESKSFTDLQGQHTGSNVQVRLPQCPVTGTQCRVRTRTRLEEELLSCGKAAQVGRVVNGSDVVPGEILFSHLECCMSPNGPIRALY